MNGFVQISPRWLAAGSEDTKFRCIMEPAAGQRKERAMFGFGFDSKVKSVLREKFDYEPGGFQMPILKQIAAEAKRQELNEFDAAIMFMMVQMNLLSPGGDDVKTFVRTHSQHVESVISLARSPCTDILNMLSDIKAKHGVAESVQAKPAPEVKS
ncbi:MAG: hypothetical protein IT564_09645 [Rhodospirillales bacterium]|nr:hypothetical protein [Rhodospirillales bacterium]